MDDKLRQLERQYRQSHLLEDLILWLKYLSKLETLNWWDAVDALRIHFYANYFPALGRQIAVGPEGSVIEILPSSRAGNDPYIITVIENGLMNNQLIGNANGLTEAIPLSYFMWGKVIFGIFADRFRITQALSRADQGPFFDKIWGAAAQHGLLPISIVNPSDVAIMDRSISISLLQSLIDYFEKYAIPGVGCSA